MEWKVLCARLMREGLSGGMRVLGWGFCEK